VEFRAQDTIWAKNEAQGLVGTVARPGGWTGDLPGLRLPEEAKQVTKRVALKWGVKEGGVNLHVGQ